MAGRSKTHARFAFQMIVSILFVYLVVRKVDWLEIGHVILNADYLFLFLSFVLSPIMVLVSVWKWHVLLRPHRITVPFSRLFVLYYVGYMFNNILPSNVGGDVVVAYELAKDTNRPFDTVASVLMNRFTGMLVLLPAAILSLIIHGQVFTDYTIVLALFAIIVASVAVLWLSLDNRPLHLLDKIFENVRIAKKVLGKLKKLQVALQVYNNNPRTLFSALGISVLFFLLMVVNVYIGCLAFSVNPSLIAILVVLPFIQVVSMLPISFGGIGLREWAYMVAFPQVGIPAAVGISVCLLLRVKWIVNGLIGGIFYPTLRKEKVDEYAGTAGQQVR